MNHIPKLPTVHYQPATYYIVSKKGKDAEDLFIGNALCMDTFCGRKSHKKSTKK